MTAILENPTEPVVGTKDSHGGFAKIAKILNDEDPGRTNPISRQLVHRWYCYRGSNDFPEKHAVMVAEGKIKLLFDLAEVRRWHMSWRQHHKPRTANPPIETIALFNVGADGIPYW